MEHSTNYTDTFICVAPDTSATEGMMPRQTATPSVALRMYELAAEAPYRYTSDELMFQVHAERKGISKRDRPAAQRSFFSKAQACLRASGLAKTYGWGIHFDGKGRLAIYGLDTPAYRELAEGNSPDGTALRVTSAMRSRRAAKR